MINNYFLLLKYIIINNFFNDEKTNHREHFWIWYKWTCEHKNNKCLI